VEEWAASNLLSLANEPGVIMRKGAQHERDSVIDLVWYNEAVIQGTTFTDLRVDWEGSLGSDHAMIHVTGSVSNPEQDPDTTDPTGFLLDPKRKLMWIQEFKRITMNPEINRAQSVEEVESAVASLMADIQTASDSTFRQCHPFHHKASPWWNAACVLMA